MLGPQRRPCPKLQMDENIKYVARGLTNVIMIKVIEMKRFSWIIQVSLNQLHGPTKAETFLALVTQTETITGRTRVTDMQWFCLKVEQWACRTRNADGF